MLHIIFITLMTVNDVNLSVAFRGVRWPEFLKKEGRRTFPERRSCIFLCKNPIKEDFHRLLYTQGAKCLIFVGCTIARLHGVSAGCTIARVRQPSYVGKMSIFSMLLEGESSMVRWPLNGLDLTLFHDLVGSS
jgi:hypothetical protein